MLFSLISSSYFRPKSYAVSDSKQDQVDRITSSMRKIEIQPKQDHLKPDKVVDVSNKIFNLHSFLKSNIPFHSDF